MPKIQYEIRNTQLKFQRERGIIKVENMFEELTDKNLQIQ